MILIDRSIPRSVARALQQVRDDIIWLDDVLPGDTPDTAWLHRAGAEGWLVITRDKKIRTRPGERAVIAAASVGAFVLDQKRDPTRWQYLRLLTVTLDEMERLFRSTPRPCLFAVSANGRIRRLF